MLDYIKATRANLNAEHDPECITTGLRLAVPDPQCKRTLFECDLDVALDLSPTIYPAAKLPRTDDTNVDVVPLYEVISGEIETHPLDISSDLMKSTD